jgi:hypothetical protein
VNTNDSVNVDIRDILLQLSDRLSRIENSLNDRPESTIAREWYTVRETAEILDKATFTVREWARNGRINAMKRDSGRGKTSEWMISRREIERIQNKGLLPRGL